MSEEQPQSPDSSNQPSVPPPPYNPPSDQFSQPPQYGEYYRPNPHYGYQQPPNAIDRLIPARNLHALLAYYFGVFSFIPCVTPVLGPLAIIFGIRGLGNVKKDPSLPGQGHAITGIVLGSLTTLAAIVIAIFIAVAAANKVR